MQVHHPDFCDAVRFFYLLSLAVGTNDLEDEAPPSRQTAIATMHIN
jgi:hypothetical protein